MTRKDRFIIKAGWLYVAVLLMVVSLSGLLFWFYHRPTLQLTEYFTHVQFWLTNKQQSLHKGFVKIKKMATETKYEVNEPDIHFEFYTSLPNMQSMQPMTLAENQSTNNPANNTDNINIKNPKSVASIANAEELEREFALHLANIRGDKK